jgi:hypothetical protein
VFRRRRPLLRAAAVGGTAYYAGKKVQQGREAEADQDARLDELEYQQQAAPPPPPPPPRSSGLTPQAMDELKQLAELKQQGILTDAEFEVQKAKILNA